MDIDFEDIYEEKKGFAIGAEGFFDIVGAGDERAAMKRAGRVLIDANRLNEQQRRGVGRALQVLMESADSVAGEFKAMADGVKSAEALGSIAGAFKNMAQQYGVNHDVQVGNTAIFDNPQLKDVLSSASHKLQGGRPLTQQEMQWIARM